MKLAIGKFSWNFWPYLLVILAIILPWFLKPGYLFFTDSVWGPNIKLDWTSSWFLFNLIIKGLSFIFSMSFLEKLFITGTLAIILLGGRLLVKTILEYYNKPKIGLIFILSLFSLFNPFVYDRALYGQFGTLVAYGCLLFTVSYLFKAWQTRNFKELYKVAIFSSIALMMSVHFVFLLLPFYLLFFISVCKFKEFWPKFLLATLIVLILNANWLIAISTHNSPLASSVEQGITNQDLVAFQTAGKNGAETFSNVLLMSGFWGKDQFRYFDLTTASGWQRSFVFLTPLIFYGLFLSFRKRSKKEKIFSFSLLLIFTLAVFLAVGIKSPITNGFVMYLYNHLPFYKGLREPQKWVAVIIPIYLFYLSLGAARLRSTKFISKNRILSAIILAAIIIMGAPSLVWGFNRQVRPTPYPSDWAEVNNLLVNRSAQSYGCSDRILFLPWHMYLSFNWVGKIIANPATVYFTCPILSGTDMEWGGIYDNSQNAEGQAVAAWLTERGDFQSPLFSSTVNSFRYIILAKEVDYNSYAWLNNLSYLKLLLETKTLLVYEIKS